MTAVRELAGERGLAVIEDCAEAHGATWGDRKVGSLGTVGTFSFYGNKIITTGEGGMITTDDGRLAQRIRFLKDHGMEKGRRYFHTELAFNYRMTNLQAALGLAQLEQIELFIAKKRQILGWYREELGGLDDVALNPELRASRNVVWMTSVLLPRSRSRDAVMRDLLEAGVDSRPFFVPMSAMPHLARFRRVGSRGEDCPVAGDLSARGINLPSGCALSRQDAAAVGAALRRAAKLSAGNG
jgi:perosamine synthetase